MNTCKLSSHNTICPNLMLRYAGSIGVYFWGCSLFPECDKTFSIDFNPNNLTEFERKIYRVFDCFVNLNSFLMVTYGTTYFNLKNAALLDFMLRSEIIRDDKSELEIGKTGARIFYDLYYHLMLMPVDAIQVYLKNNFPKNYQLFKDGKKAVIFKDIDYKNNTVNENSFSPYKEAYLNY